MVYLLSSRWTSKHTVVAIFPLLEHVISQLSNPFMSSFAAWQNFLTGVVANCDGPLCAMAFSHVLRCHRRSREEAAFDAAIRALFPHLQDGKDKDGSAVMDASSDSSCTDHESTPVLDLNAERETSRPLNLDLVRHRAVCSRNAACLALAPLFLKSHHCCFFVFVVALFSSAGCAEFICI